MITGMSLTWHYFYFQYLFNELFLQTQTILVAPVRYFFKLVFPPTRLVSREMANTYLFPSFSTHSFTTCSYLLTVVSRGEVVYSSY